MSAHTPEPKNVDVRVWHNLGSSRIRIELDIEFEIPAQAENLNAEITKTRQRIAAGEKPKIEFRLWTIAPGLREIEGDA